MNDSVEPSAVPPPGWRVGRSTAEHHTTGGVATGGSELGRTLRLVTVPVVASLYAVACLLPAVEVAGWSYYELGDWHQTRAGWIAAVLGWFSPFALPWFANPVLLAGWVALIRGNGRWAAVLGGVAFTLGLSVWLLVVERYQADWPKVGLTGVFNGYYFWQASMLALVVGAVPVGVVAEGQLRVGAGRTCYDTSPDGRVGY